MAQNKDLVADAQTLLEENLSEKKSVESARRITMARASFLYIFIRGAQSSGFRAWVIGHPLCNI